MKPNSPAVVDLPTPPLPEATAMISLIPSIEEAPLAAALFSCGAATYPLTIPNLYNPQNPTKSENQNRNQSRYCNVGASIPQRSVEKKKQKFENGDKGQFKIVPLQWKKDLKRKVTSETIVEE